MHSQNSKLPIEKNVNYVALGDSFAAGFNSKFGFNANGKLENGQITGLGYPSFLADILRDFNFRIENFHNLSIPNTSLDFLYSLIKNDKKALISKYENRLDCLQSLDWHARNPFKYFFSSLLKDWNIKNNDYLIFQNLIKQANFITLTIGYNELLHRLPYRRILRLSKNKTNFVIELKEIISIIEKESEAIAKDYEKLVNLIKQINPKAHLVLTNYSNLFYRLKEVFLNYIYKNENEDINLYQVIADCLSKMAIVVSKNTDCSYVDIFEAKYWDNYSNYLLENPFSIMPTEKGYKKIAYDLFAKLALNKKDIVLDMSNNINLINNYITDQTYWIKDIKTHQQIFNTNYNNYQLFKNIYGKNKNSKIISYTNLEKKSVDILKQFYNTSDYLDLLTRYSNNSLYQYTKGFFDDKFMTFFSKYNSIEAISTFLKNQKWSKEVFLTLIKNGKLDKMLFEFQNLILKQELNQQIIKPKYFYSAWKEMVLNNQKHFYNVFKQFFDSGIIEQTKGEIKTITRLFLKDALNTDLLSALFNIKQSNRFQDIKIFLSSLKSFDELVDFIIDIITSSFDYKKLNSFDELWKDLIIKNKYKFLVLLNKIFFEVFDDNKTEETIQFIINTIQTVIRMQKLTAKDQNKITKVLNKIVDTIKANPNFLNNNFMIFLEKIKTLKIYSLIFNNDFKTLKWKIIKFLHLNRYLFINLKIGFNVLKIKI
ncbi:SGNH/GDSL hydrolase family protein [Mycoplasma struthionis]|uniref:SGNH/GDSL hydrolase family protein n=1 Tax=Mycoplasma struthionis TaxID=538220 RepID=A0A502MI90_9MOLU|nr:SGNH/GDSL hydrolase family protein [Mycoplasma struthionis]TPI01300.1 SGNH/GDSL hydrolase family protein [Mycoplasma struthionis]